MLTTNVTRCDEFIRLSIDLNEIQDVDLLLESILFRARKFLNADAGSIMIKRKNELEFYHSQNDTLENNLKTGEKSIYNNFRIKLNKSSLAGYVALTGEILNIENAYNIPDYLPFKFNPSYDTITNYKTISILTVPLQIKKNIIGVMQIINAKDKNNEIIPFNKEDELYVQHFSNNASFILQRTIMTKSLILRMISMAELRDPMETGAHVNRVAYFSVALYEIWAKKKGITQAEINKKKDILRLSAMLHDVGKVAISDVLLKKPGKLTNDEFELMKRHTIYGAILFSMKNSEFDEISEIVALNHHENWDGTGYPGHIDVGSGTPLKIDKIGKPVPKKHDEIPIFGRIVALADVYDALMSKRVYKNAWNKLDVTNEIIKLRAKKFDPELVDLFMDNLNIFENIKIKYPEKENSPD